MRPGHPRPSSRSNAGRGETGGIIFAATDKIENRNAMERIVEFPTDRETEEGDRPIYDEEGHRNDPGGE